MNTTLDQETKNLGDWAYLGIAKHFEKILQYEAPVLADRDHEDLHQMRVGMRRLRSTLGGFSLALDLPKQASPQKIGKIARILGKLRDLDVLEEQFTKRYLPHLNQEESQVLGEVRQSLASQRKNALKAVRSCLKGKLYLGFKQALEDWLAKPKYEPISQVEMSKVLADLLLPQASKLLLHPGWLVGVERENLQREEIEALLEEEGLILHDLRKEAKRSRYNMELFAQFYPEKYQEYLQEVKNLQTVLGEIQDGFVLGEFLGGVYGKNWKTALPTLVEKFQEVRQQKWQEWVALQGKFLQEQNRKDFHLAILNN